jgi:hypothetical protein
MFETGLYRTTYIVLPDLSVEKNLMVYEVAPAHDFRFAPYVGFSLIEQDSCSDLQFGLAGTLDGNDFASLAHIRFMYAHGRVDRISYSNYCNGGIQKMHEHLVRKFSNRLTWQFEQLNNSTLHYTYSIYGNEVVHFYGDSTNFEMVSIAQDIDLRLELTE